MKALIQLIAFIAMLPILLVTAIVAIVGASATFIIASTISVFILSTLFFILKGIFS